MKPMPKNTVFKTMIRGRPAFVPSINEIDNITGV